MIDADLQYCPSMCPLVFTLVRLPTSFYKITDWCFMSIVAITFYDLSNHTHDCSFRCPCLANPWTVFDTNIFYDRCQQMSLPVMGWCTLTRNMSYTGIKGGLIWPIIKYHWGETRLLSIGHSELVCILVPECDDKAWKCKHMVNKTMQIWRIW